MNEKLSKVLETFTLDPEEPDAIFMELCSLTSMIFSLAEEVCSDDALLHKMKLIDTQLSLLENRAERRNIPFLQYQIKRYRYLIHKMKSEI